MSSKTARAASALKVERCAGMPRCRRGRCPLPAPLRTLQCLYMMLDLADRRLWG
jgi:hypothetical protein